MNMYKFKQKGSKLLKKIALINILLCHYAIIIRSNIYN